MTQENRMLKILSNELKKAISNIPIITPSIFTTLFVEHVKKLHLEIPDEKELSKKIIDSECQKLTQLQDSASKSIATLSDNTTKAIHAIKTKDTQQLQDVYKETQILRHEIKKLKKTLYQDELTLAFNRKWFHDHYIKPQEGYFNTDGVLGIVDLNFFKQVNDTHGHITGDKVLQFITIELKSLPASVVRYGGDEFLLVFSSESSELEAMKLIRKLREKVISKKIKSNGESFHISFSFGVTSYFEDQSFETILEDADKKMYTDKIEFKKRVQSI